MRPEQSIRHGWGVKHVRKDKEAGVSREIAIHDLVYQGTIETGFSSLLFFRRKKDAQLWISKHRHQFQPGGRLVPMKMCIRVYADW